MRARGIANPVELLTFADTDGILGAIRWFDSQHGVGPGLLAKAIRDGGMPDFQPRRVRSLIDDQKLYAAQIIGWLGSKLPDVCRVPERIVELDRQTFGEESALRLAACDQPHYAAIAAVLRLHAAGDKLTVKEHAKQIRAAVAAAHECAIADYRTILSRRGEPPAETSERLAS